jgi:acetylornithine deacetylase/succinyl-diaminopimelate desuccinylase
MFNGHLDTVPAYGMERAFEPEVRDGFLWGRGSADMKGPVAAMMVAMKLLKELALPLRGDLIFAGVVGEEERSEGTEFLVRKGPRTDRCVVGEPSGLRIRTAHRGLEWLEFTFIGRAAHGGTPQEGINAISMAARFVRRVEDELMPELAKRVHPVMGPAIMNFGLIRGGTQPSTVADRCILQVDRRWVPGESVDRVLGEYQALIDVLSREDRTFSCTMKRMEENMATMDHMPMEISWEDPLVRALAEVRKDRPGAAAPGPIPFGGWTDASLLSNYAGIPTLVFGPGDAAVAHSPEERVSLEELREAVLAYVLLAARFCGVEENEGDE